MRPQTGERARGEGPEDHPRDLTRRARRIATVEPHRGAAAPMATLALEAEEERSLVTMQPLKARVHDGRPALVTTATANGTHEEPGDACSGEGGLRWGKPC